MKRFLQIISLVLMLTMCFSAFGLMSAFSQDKQESSLSSDASSLFEYSIIDAEVTVTKYTGSEKNVTIPSEINCLPVTEIGDRAFMNQESLVSVSIPEGVRKIGYCAFENCTSLEKINIPASVTTIVRGSDYYDQGTWYNRAFYNTAYYNNEENWEDGLLYIDNALIAAKEDICGERKIKEGTTLIADWTFFNCQGLTQLYIPSSVTHIGIYAFASCGLPWVYIPLSVERVNCAFHHFFSPVYYEGTQEQWDQIFEDYICEDCSVSITFNASYPTTPTEPLGTYLLGDVNLNGRVNIVDATLIQKSVAGLVTLGEESFILADTNLDKNVNIKDATEIQKFLADLETGYPIGEEKK